MKILYIGPERRGAQAAGAALRTIAPNVTLTWARSPAPALSWIRDNRDANAVVVDTALPHQECKAFVEQVRVLGLATPVSLIAAAHVEGLLSALAPGPDTAGDAERSTIGILDARLRQVEERRQQEQQHLVELQAQHDVALARSSRICSALQTRLFELESALHQAEDRHAAQTAAAEQSARREKQLSSTVAQEVAARTAAERELGDREAAHQCARERAAAELAAAVERYSTAENHLTRERRSRTTREERLAAVENARQDAAQKHEAELAAITARALQREAQHDASLTRARRISMALQERLLDLEAEIHTAEQRHAADAAAAEQLALRETELRAALAAANGARTAVEQKLADSEAAYEEALQRAAADLSAAAERHAALDDRLGQEIEVRTRLAGQLAVAQAARHEAAQRHAEEVAVLTAHRVEICAQYDAAVRRTTSVERQLRDAAAALEEARRDWKLGVAAAAEQLALRETELSAALADALAARVAVEQKLADSEAAHQDARQRAAADLTTATARHAALEAQLSDVRVTVSSLRADLAAAEEGRRLTLAASRRDTARVQQEADGLRREVAVTRKRAAALQRDAARVPALQLELEGSRKDNRRLFERAPYGLCEWRDGVLTRVNHSLALMLGYRRSADLQSSDVVATVFESAGDLRWVLERATQTGKPQSVDTALKTRDKRRLAVRLHALTADGPVVMAVEDLTKLAALEQRLREARRMEAVGRVASEVAVTCDTMLRDVTRGGRQWLSGFESDIVLRQQGERLLGDVTRAAGFLRQFVAYGHKEIGNDAPVSMPRLLRDLEPVLKCVLGDDISLALPKTSNTFDVDADAERVERILVHVANYARERMPHGGRVNIQLATAFVDRRFLASHPGTRPGSHVVITITELQGAIRPGLPIHLAFARTVRADVPAPAPDKPGMDLGPLVGLIADVGGHLWMVAEPAGNMTVQIHLPKRSAAEVTESARPASRTSRVGQLGRWFGH